MDEVIQKGWSFCFVTGGTDDKVYADCVASIHDEFNGRDDFEIISVGQSSLHDDPALVSGGAVHRTGFQTIFQEPAAGQKSQKPENAVLSNRCHQPQKEYRGSACKV